VIFQGYECFVEHILNMALIKKPYKIDIEVDVTSKGIINIEPSKSTDQGVPFSKEKKIAENVFYILRILHPLLAVVYFCLMIYVVVVSTKYNSTHNNFPIHKITNLFIPSIWPQSYTYIELELSTWSVNILSVVLVVIIGNFLYHTICFVEIILIPKSHLYWYGVVNGIHPLRWAFYAVTFSAIACIISILSGFHTENEIMLVVSVVVSVVALTYTAEVIIFNKTPNILSTRKSGIFPFVKTLSIPVIIFAVFLTFLLIHFYRISDFKNTPHWYDTLVTGVFYIGLTIACVTFTFMTIFVYHEYEELINIFLVTSLHIYFIGIVLKYALQENHNPKCVSPKPSSIPGLPEYLVIGDSISRNYVVGGNLLNKVSDIFAGQIITPNGEGSYKNARCVDTWLGNKHWGIVTVNFAIWDAISRVPMYNYDYNLRRVFKRIMKASDRVIWISGTPIAKKQSDGYEAPMYAQFGIPAYNAYAYQMAKSLGIETCNIFKNITDLCGGNTIFDSCLPYLSDGVHLNDDASQLVSDVIEDCIRNPGSHDNMFI